MESELELLFFEPALRRSLHLAIVWYVATCTTPATHP